MPNLILTSNAKFRPFEYSEMLAPVLMATQAHQAVEEAYSELDSQANAIGSLANETNDPVTYARYKSYEASLRNQADILAKNGLTPGSRKSLLDLKGRYAKEITPIQNAITRRGELADEQRKALLQNPTLMFQRDMNSVSYDSSLDRFLENPDYDYGQQYSGALLTQQVSQAAGNLAKELTNYGNGKRLDAYTKTFLQQHGFTREQVLDAITNPDRAKSQPVLNAIVEQVVGSSGMANWADNPTMTKAYNYARQGLWSAIGQTNVSPYADYGAKLSAKAGYSTDKSKAKESKVPDITAWYFPKDRKNIENVLDSNGNLKTNPNSWGASSKLNLVSRIFKNGKFTKPSGGGPYQSEANEAIRYYNTINNILLGAGFSQDVINRMDRSNIEKSLKDVYNQNINDAIGRNIYRFSLDDNATEFLIQKLNERGLPVREIVGMDNMVPKLGDSKDLEYEKGTTGSILYDPKGNLTGLQYQGKYHQLPAGMISKNFYTLMDEYASDKTQDKIKEAKEIQKALLNKFNTTGTLSDRELAIYQSAENLIDYWGSAFDDVGNSFVNYIGTRNINTSK